MEEQNEPKPKDYTFDVRNNSIEIGKTIKLAAPDIKALLLEDEYFMNVFLGGEYLVAELRPMDKDGVVKPDIRFSLITEDEKEQLEFLKHFAGIRNFALHGSHISSISKTMFMFSEYLNTEMLRDEERFEVEYDLKIEDKEIRKL